MSYLDVVLADSPVVVLALDEASGTVAADSSGNGNDATYAGGPTLGETGPWPGHTATLFTDSGQYVVTDAQFAYPGGDITLELWFKGSTKPTGGRAILASLGDEENGFYYSPELVLDSDGHVVAHVYPTFSDVQGTVDITDGNWHHIVCTAHSDGLVKLYIDGVLDGDPVALVSLWGASPLYLWVAAGASETYELGDVDGQAAWVALYDHALTLGRIGIHYAGEEPDPPPDPPPPENPTIAGTPAPGHVMRCQPGSWYTDGGAAISYQWRRDGDDIASAISSTYTLQTADDGHVIDCYVTATGTPTESIASDSVNCGSAATVTWNTAYRQSWEPDTIFLFDPDQEAMYWTEPGVDSLLDMGGRDTSTAACNPWRGGSPYTIVDGKYRHGLQASAGGDHEWVWLPGIILPTRQWTIEFWVKSSNAWSAESNYPSLLTFGQGHDSLDRGAASLDIYVDYLAGGKPRLGGRMPDDTSNWNITWNTVPAADTWVHLAITFDGSTITFYGNGSEIGTHAITPPTVWSAYDFGFGAMSMLEYGYYAGAGTQWVISDIRISRVCRVPSVPVDVTSASTVTFTDTETGAATNRYLRAGAKDFGVDPATLAVADTLGILLMPTGKFDSGLPSKAGAPDVDHPTLGNSGSYSYDFRPLDHLFTYLMARGAGTTLGFGSCPEILGGANPPLDSADCADPDVLGTSHVDFNPQVPSDFEDYGTICADIYHYAVTTYPSVPIPLLVYGNEPEAGGASWEGTQTEFFDCYAAFAAAIKAINADQLVGGPGNGDYTLTRTTWVQPLIDYCGTNDVPLDFWAYHSYTGDVAIIDKINADLPGWCADAGIPMPLIVLGEYGWNDFNLPGVGEYPWRDGNWFVNDWAASYTAMLNMVHQQAGTYMCSFFKLDPVSVSSSGFDALGVVDADKPWATGNVFRMLSLIN